MHQSGEDIAPGTEVTITLSEPWDVVTKMSSPRRLGSVASASGNKALVLCLDEEIEVGGEHFTRFLAFPRHVQERFSRDGGSTFSNLVSIAEAESAKDALQSPTTFRGKAMLLGDIAVQMRLAGG